MSTVAKGNTSPADGAATGDTGARAEIADVQGRNDTRRLAIDQVGVCDIRHPVKVACRDGGTQATIATVGMYVNLAHHLKGTHMSRFIQVLNADDHALSVNAFEGLLEAMALRLEAESAYIDMRFPFFMSKAAPVTGQAGVMDYEVALHGERHGDRIETHVEVKVPITTLCPCSRDISDYGAHNQRSLVTLTVRADNDFWIEELIEMIESEGSSELYSILKRVDEKAVTERAYENPKFVEDVVRDIATRLNADERIRWYAVDSENFESIHNHSAYAKIIHDKDAPAR